MRKPNVPYSDNPFADTTVNEDRRLSTSSDSSSVASDDNSDDDPEIINFPGTDYQASIRPSTIRSYFTKDRMIFFVVGFAITLLVAAMIPQQHDVEDAATALETSSNLTKDDNQTGSTENETITVEDNDDVDWKQEEIVPHHGIKHVQFVPYPHNDIGIGSEEAGCDWMTVYDIKEGTLKSSLLGGHTVFETTDLIQKRALTDMICLPRKPSIQKKLHVFSSNQARTCLENVTLLMTGDSFTEQLYIGLGEILLGVPSPIPSATDPFKTEMQGEPQREKVRQQMEKDLQLIGINEQTLLWKCDDHCDGQKGHPFYHRCGYCIRGIDGYLESNQRQHPTTTPKSIVRVVGAGVHIYLNQEHNNVTATVEQLQQFADYNKHGVILVSPQPWEGSSEKELKYHSNITNDHEQFENVYWEFLPFVKQQRLEHKNVDQDKMKLRYLDVFQATGHCSMKNCSYDTGGHRSRFVNRWKAQLLLNTLCRYIP